MKKNLKERLMTRMNLLIVSMLVIAGQISGISGSACSAQGGSEGNSSVITLFKSPDMDSKNMFRWWFPSADVEESLIREQIQALYDAGFGGVEVAIVPHWAEYDASIYGWGTPKYVEMLKYILRAARALPEKFRVDITITAHWPPSLNTVDPNDPAASKELSYAYKKIVPGKGIELPMPVTKTEDGDGKQSAEFIFTDRFVSASIAKVAAIDGSQVTLEYGSMKDITGMVTQVIDPATGQPKYSAAGIPENSTLFGDKEKMNDRQYYYQVDLDASMFEPDYEPGAESGLKAGDWILFGYYTRGTGQVLSGTGMMNFNYPMPDRMYALDYYAKEGAQAIIDYWNLYILTDPELLELLKWAGGDLFEDSIENFSTGPFWTNDLLKHFRGLRDYDLAPYMPFVASARGSDVTFLSSNGNQERIRQDLSLVMNDLYLDNRIGAIQEWSHGFNYGYRAQAYGGEGDVSDAAVVLDVAEQEGNDRFFEITGGVHLKGKKFVSMETLTAGGMTYSLTWKYAADQISGAWAAGCNRLIFHGTAYEKETSHKYDAWPGWHAFQSMFGEPWAPRQIHWNDISILADFIARNQAVLQNGRPAVDIAFYKEENTNVSHLPVLINHGYTYEVLTKLALKQPEAVVLNERLAPEGPGYKAILLNGQQAISMEGADKLQELAHNGLPVVIFGTVPDRLNGVSGEDVSALSGSKPKDSDVQAKMAELLSIANVVRVTDESQLIPMLNDLGITASAQYDQDGIRNYRRSDYDGSQYYYLLNVNDEPADFQVALSGQGVPYILDSWTGKITPLVSYVRTGNGIQTWLKLGARESVIIALSDDRGNFGAAPAYHVTESDLDVKYADGKIEGVSDKTGTFHYSTSDGESRNVSIENTGEVIIPGSWDLEIESWGPGDDPDRPAISRKTMIAVGKTPLVSWDKLAVTEEAMAAAGVDSMAQVSGIGYYTASFSLGREWTGGYGAVLKFDHGDDMITSVEINGKPLPPVNQSKNTIDIGGYLVKGNNTIRIKVVSTLINRVKAENELFQGSNPFGAQRGGMGEGGPGGQGGPGGPGGAGGPGGPGGPGGAGGPGGFPQGEAGFGEGAGPMRNFGTPVFGASGIAGSRGAGQEVHYGLTGVEIIPYAQVDLNE